MKSLYFLVFIIGVSLGVILHSATQDIRYQASNEEASKAVYNISYFKDKIGNCYAYEPNTPKFSWIPCELVK